MLRTSDRSHGGAGVGARLQDSEFWILDPGFSPPTRPLGSGQGLQ